MPSHIVSKYLTEEEIELKIQAAKQYWKYGRILLKIFGDDSYVGSGFITKLSFADWRIRARIAVWAGFISKNLDNPRM